MNNEVRITCDIVSNLNKENITQRIKVLETEIECINRDCDRNCSKCDLVMDKDEIETTYKIAEILFASRIPVKPVEDPHLINGGWFGWQAHCCGACGNQLRTIARYCDRCGRPVDRRNRSDER